MRYCTYFSLAVDNDQRYNFGICKALHDKLWEETFIDLSFEEVDLNEYKYIDYDDVFFTEELHWYDWYTDMVELSKMFPDCTFHLEGRGDDYDDWWEAHFKNGHGYQQMAIIPPFDPAKLRMEDTCLGIDEVI